MPYRVLIAALILAVLSVQPAAFAETSGAQSLARGDYARAIKELTLAAKRGDHQAELDLGMAILQGKGAARDAAVAFRWIKNAADAEIPEAEYQLGQMKENGVGTEQNSSEAADWYRKAAQQGQVQAMYALGELYRTGDGVPRDEAQAVRWYRPAAEKNHIDSQLALGKLYRDGGGVPKSLPEARVWFLKAAQLGSPEGRYLLAMLLLDATPPFGLGHAPSRQSVEAVQWLQAAAEQDYAPAQYYLGMAHLNGVEATLDVEQAIGLLRKAADQNLPEAQAVLGRIFAEGKLARRNPTLAYLYLDLAARQGQDDAAQLRDQVARDLGQPQLQMARRRVKDWLDQRDL